MEMANLCSGVKKSAKKVRTAVQQDKADIMLLLQNGRYTHVHLDWQPPVNWVGERGFVVVPTKAETSSPMGDGWFGWGSSLLACLAAVADPAPAAWVRTAALRREDEAQELLAAMLDQVSNYLQDTAVTELGWLVLNDWPLKWLPSLGFNQVNEIVTYSKYDMDTPVTAVPKALTIRSANLADMDMLAAIEAAAFDPLWRHSACALRQAYHQAFSFDIAEWNGRVAGFQYSTSNQDSAHLARMTILPELQRAGIGSALLSHTIQGYKHSKLRYITLNTQIDNYPSQKLYTKYGFQVQDQKLPLWVKSIPSATHKPRWQTPH